MRLLIVISLCLSRANSFVGRLPAFAVGRLWSTSDDDDDVRSIGDVVQGLHGSKYQFDSPGINFEGRRFAEMGYGSTEVESAEFHVDPDEPLPNWARRLQETDVSTLGSCPELIVGRGTPTSIIIENDERTWEIYYAFILGEEAAAFSTSPSVGQLAPRGGSGRFSDSAEVLVSLTSEGIKSRNWLVVGTEEESWKYQLVPDV